MNLDINSTLTLQNATQENAVQNAAKKARALEAKQKEAISDKNMEKYDAVAKDFEAMFMTEMLKPMFAELKPNETFGGGKGEEIFSGMMLQEYGKMMAETGQIGIADSVRTELIRMQGGAQNLNEIRELPPLKSVEKSVETTEPNSLDTIIAEQINAQ